MFRRNRSSHTATELFHQLSIATDPDGWVDYDFLRERMTIAAIRGDKDLLKTYLQRPTVAGDRNKAAALLVKQVFHTHSRVDSKKHNAKIVIETQQVPTCGGRTQERRTRVRFTHPELATQWRQPKLPDYAPIVKADPIGKKGNTVPERPFAGVMESDGWKAAPLRYYDLVFFTAPDLPMDAILPYLPDGVREEAPVNTATRLICPLGTGDATRRAVEHAALMQPHPPRIKNINRQTIKRRNLKELDPKFYEAMAAHYLEVSIRRLNTKARSIHAYQGDDRSEVASKAASYMIDIMRQYDDSKSDFGQFLSGKLVRKAHDDARQFAGGRNASDTERRMRRAEQAITARDEDVTDEALARELGITVEKVHKQKSLIVNIVGQRYAESLSEPGDDDSASRSERLADVDSDHVADYDRWIDHTEAFNRLLDASEPTDPYRVPTPRPSAGYADHGVVTPNIAGLWTYVSSIVNEAPREHVARDLDVSPRTLQRMLNTFTTRLDNPDHKPQTQVEDAHDEFLQLLNSASAKRPPSDDYTSHDAVAVHGDVTPNIIGLLGHQADLMGTRTTKELCDMLGIKPRHLKDAIATVRTPVPRDTAAYL